jgi:hypothetical protein
MSEDKSAGASYLNALKQGASAPGGAATARSTHASESKPTPNSQPSEKRKSPRYRCQGSAQLRDKRSGSSTWATFTDISLHGCYVEAMSTFEVGSELALMVEVNNFRVECGGIVRVVYPGLGMGISFASMTEHYQERLRELLRSLSRPSAILGMRAAGAAPVISAVPQNDLPEIRRPEAALDAIRKFFEERQMLSRDEFRRILRRSQE